MQQNTWPKNQLNGRVSLGSQSSGIAHRGSRSCGVAVALYLQSRSRKPRILVLSSQSPFYSALNPSPWNIDISSGVVFLNPEIPSQTWPEFYLWDDSRSFQTNNQYQWSQSTPCQLMHKLVMFSHNLPFLFFLGSWTYFIMQNAFILTSKVPIVL